MLTRLPSPHRLSPRDAWRVLDANFVHDVTVSSLEAPAYARLLRGLAEAGTGGGRTYDAVIGECVLDPPPAGVAVVEPGAR